MGIDCKIYLPAKARLHDVAQVLGALLGNKKVMDSTDRFARVDRVSTRSSSMPECAYIDIGEGATKRQFLYHFEFGSQGEHGIMPRSTPENIELMKGLADFFGGRVDFSDSDASDCDYFVEEQPDINATDGDAWARLQAKIMSVQPCNSATE